MTKHASICYHRYHKFRALMVAFATIATTNFEPCYFPVIRPLYYSYLYSEFVHVICPSICWSPSTSFLVVWSPSGDMRGPSVKFELDDDHFHYGVYINYCGFFSKKKKQLFFMDLYFCCIM